ncbi:hypothetical protein [Salmonella phage NINP13076]|nr:hypothetical protein [Salmonella phage NINP13076]
MSDYKILHKREYGQESWEVFYKGESLRHFTPSVRDNFDMIAGNPYHSLENAKKIIEEHKAHTKWLEEERRKSVREWLDDQGNVITNSVQKMMVIPIDPRPTHQLVMRGIYAYCHPSRYTPHHRFSDRHHEHLSHYPPK